MAHRRSHSVARAAAGVALGERSSHDAAPRRWWPRTPRRVCRGRTTGGAGPRVRRLGAVHAPARARALRTFRGFRARPAGPRAKREAEGATRHRGSCRRTRRLHRRARARASHAGCQLAWLPGRHGTRGATSGTCRGSRPDRPDGRSRPPVGTPSGVRGVARLGPRAVVAARACGPRRCGPRAACASRNGAVGTRRSDRGAPAADRATRARPARRLRCVRRRRVGEVRCDVTSERSARRRPGRAARRALHPAGSRRRGHRRVRPRRTRAGSR